MANTLTSALPTLISTFQSVLREATGFIKKTNTDFNDQGAAKDTSVTIPIGGAMTAADVTPAIATSAGSNTTLGSLTHTLDKYRKVSFHLTQEEVVALRENREGFTSNRVAQAIRTLVNEIETDIGAEAKTASRAVGAGGTTPFASNHDVLADLGQILDENGVEAAGRNFVMDSAAKNNLSKLSTLLDASALGSDAMNQNGAIGRLDGFDLGHSLQVGSATKGTGSSYISDGGSAIGATSIPIDTGSGTVLAGDLVKFGSDTNVYVVTTGVVAAGTITIAEPGLKVALADSGTMTIQTNGVQNFGFTTDAIAVSVRPPIRDDADQADEIILISDPDTGLTFELAHYPQYRQGAWEMSCLWGVTNVHPEKTAMLIG